MATSKTADFTTSTVPGGAKRLKIALVSYDFGEYMVQMANGLSAYAEVKLFLADTQYKGREEMLNPSVSIHVLHWYRMRQPLQNLREMASLRKALNEFRPDVIHIQKGGLYLNLLLPFIKQYPLVITIHDVVHHPGDHESRRVPESLIRWGNRQADRLITHTQAVKSLVIETQGLPESDLEVVPHVALGVDGAEKVNVGNPAPHQVLFFGRIWEYKGLEYLIKAQPQISAAVPDAKIVIGGRGEDFARYTAMMQNPDAFDVHNRYIPDEERDLLFASAAVVVLPYIEASTSGVVPVAYGFGKPVVATTVGGLPEMVIDGETGYLVPPRDVDALAEAVIKVLQDDNRRRKMGEAARDLMAREWSEDACARKTLAVYESAIAARQAKA
jgi:glycosyltransferase involved in cell wall biosynthesis